MADNITQIYDKIFKKIITLSSVAVTNLINGLFDTDYSPDSTIEYNWTEFHSDNLKHILADTILTINGCHYYHMEAQMEKDEDIVFRVFEYGFGHASRHRENINGQYTLRFPEPKIIYLYYEGRVPDTYELMLDFGTQGSFCYHVPVCKFPEISTQEINDRKMVILIPFQLLKLRKLLEKERSKENLELLINLIQNDIIGSIDTNLRLGNITPWDCRRLKHLTSKLYEHIYAHYEELEVVTNMTDESLILDIDLIEAEFEQRLAQAVEQRLEQAVKQAVEQAVEQTMALNDKELADRDAEIARLKKLLAEKES